MKADGRRGAGSRPGWRARSHHIIHRRTWRQFFQRMGPGIVSGAADNDPAGVVTYIQVGATTGLGLLWLMFLATPMLYYLEEMSTRLGVVTKRGIGRVLRSRYGSRVATAVVGPVVLSNVLTVGADLAGTAAALELLTGIAWEWWIVPLAALLASTLIFASYRTISRFLLLLTPLFVLYIITGLIVHPHWDRVLRATFVPAIQFTPTYFTAALGLLGATLTPYMFFWQTTEEVEARRKVEDLPGENADVAAGMIYANLVFYFIILVAGVVLFGKGVNVQTVRDAALSLRPLAGPGAGLLFGLGIIVSGTLAIPVMAACTAYSLAELFGWAEGLDKKIWQARGFYLLVAGALAVGGAIALLHISPVTLMFWSQIVNGFLLPPLFFVLVRLANDPSVLRGYTNGRMSNIVGWGSMFLTLALALLTLQQLVGGR
ncbi:MAG TPA: divalent metal cation transporter [bacterium]|nr:divalent metal cation transporter [bacterium]